MQPAARWETLGEIGDSNLGGGDYRLAGKLDGNPGHPQEIPE